MGSCSSGSTQPHSLSPADARQEVGRGPFPCQVATRRPRQGEGGRPAGALGARRLRRQRRLRSIAGAPEAASRLTIKADAGGVQFPVAGAGSDGLGGVHHTRPAPVTHRAREDRQTGLVIESARCATTGCRRTCKDGGQGVTEKRNANKTNTPHSSLWVGEHAEPLLAGQRELHTRRGLDDRRDGTGSLRSPRQRRMAGPLGSGTGPKPQQCPTK